MRSDEWKVWADAQFKIITDELNRLEMPFSKREFRDHVAVLKGVDFEWFIECGRGYAGYHSSRARIQFIKHRVYGRGESNAGRTVTIGEKTTKENLVKRVQRFVAEFRETDKDARRDRAEKKRAQQVISQRLNDAASTLSEGTGVEWKVNGICNDWDLTPRKHILKIDGVSGVEVEQSASGGWSLRVDNVSLKSIIEMLKPINSNQKKS